MTKKYLNRLDPAVSLSWHEPRRLYNAHRVDLELYPTDVRKAIPVLMSLYVINKKCYK
jgi:hypothetical protein